MKSYKQYLAQLEKTYIDIPENKRDIADELLRRLADVLVMMDECKAELDKHGCVTTQSRGDYEITKENPASKLYDAKHKLMLSTMDKLDKMLPDESASRKDELMEFLDDDAV